MHIDLERLAPDGETFEGEEPARILDLAEDEFYRSRDGIRYVVRAQIVSDELIVTGRLSTRVAFFCSRCGETSAMRIEEPEFQRIYDLRSEEVPRVPECPACVDLTADIREATILRFPAFPVCRSDCKGLCPLCGTNLNTGSCDCRAPRDGRWDALEGLDLN